MHAEDETGQIESKMDRREQPGESREAAAEGDHAALSTFLIGGQHFGQRTEGKVGNKHEERTGQCGGDLCLAQRGSAKKGRPIGHLNEGNTDRGDDDRDSTEHEERGGSDDARLFFVIVRVGI